MSYCSLESFPDDFLIVLTRRSVRISNTQRSGSQWGWFLSGEYVKLTYVNVNL
jgi:hypothetical protein